MYTNRDWSNTVQLFPNSCRDIKQFPIRIIVVNLLQDSATRYATPATYDISLTLLPNRPTEWRLLLFPLCVFLARAAQSAYSYLLQLSRVAPHRGWPKRPIPWILFTARSSYASAVIGDRIYVCPPVRLSVCLSHACFDYELSDQLKMYRISYPQAPKKWHRNANSSFEE